MIVNESHDGTDSCENTSLLTKEDSRWLKRSRKSSLGRFCKRIWYVSVLLLVTASACILSTALYAGISFEPRINNLVLEAENAFRVFDANLPLINETVTEVQRVIQLAKTIETIFENACKKYPWLCEANNNASAGTNCSEIVFKLVH